MRRRAPQLALVVQAPGVGTPSRRRRRMVPPGSHARCPARAHQLAACPPGFAGHRMPQLARVSDGGAPVPAAAVTAVAAPHPHRARSVYGDGVAARSHQSEAQALQPVASVHGEGGVARSTQASWPAHAPRQQLAGTGWRGGGWCGEDEQEEAAQESHRRGTGLHAPQGKLVGVCGQAGGLRKPRENVWQSTHFVGAVQEPPQVRSAPTRVKT